MRRRLGQGLRLGVAANAVALVQTSRWGGPATLVGAQAYSGAGGLRDALAALLGSSHAGWPLTVVLADELARLWQVTPPPQCTRVADLEAAAALRFQRLYGESAADWVVRADWDAGRPFLAAALPRALLGAIEAGAGFHQMKLVEIAPQFVTLLNLCRGKLLPGAWFGTLHDKVLTLGAREAGCVVAVRAQAVPDSASAGWLAEHLAREALRLNLAAPERLQLWGALPPAWIGVGAVSLGAAGGAGWTPTAVLAAGGSAA